VTRDDQIVKWGRTAGIVLAGAACCAAALLAWFGYRAASEWQRSSELLVARRADETTEILTTALTRDMRAVQTTVLDNQDWDASSFVAPFEINDLIASAFARYPYPELFFGFRGADPDHIVFFARADRRPGWLQPASEDLHPVLRASSDAASALLGSRILKESREGDRYSIFETEIAGRNYQVVARLRYAQAAASRLDAVFGFLVDVEWTREAYFGPLTQQVSRIAEPSGQLRYQLADERGARIAGVALAGNDLAFERRLPILFFDPNLIALDRPDDLSERIWRVTVSGAEDETLALAASGARQTLVVIAVATLAIAVGLYVTVRAVRANADVAVMRSDFVSTVTHELKTPIATIRAIAETFARGRVNTPEGIRNYGHLLMQEQGRLMRLVDNLLAYARVTDVTDVYSFQPQDAVALAEEALNPFKPLLEERGFTVERDLPVHGPQVNADRTAMVLALSNLIDNAMRYSGNSRWLAIRVAPAGSRVEFIVEDRGLGIPESDIALIPRRFVRGRSVEGHGSGLGLAIVNRVAKDHGGELIVRSEVGRGTQMTLALPRIDEDADA